MKEISLDQLAEVTGGKVNDGGYQSLDVYIQYSKCEGLDLKAALERFERENWNKCYMFRYHFTDGSQADLNTCLQYIKDNWGRY